MSNEKSYKNVLKVTKTSILNIDTRMSVTVASERTKQQEENGSVTKSANLQRREKERKRANGGRAVRGGIVRCAVRE